MEKKNEGAVRNLIALLLVIFALVIGASVVGDLMHEKSSSTAVVASSSDSDDEEDYDYDDDDDDYSSSSSSSSSYSYSSSSSSSSSYSYSSSSEFNPADYEVPDFNTWNHDQLEYGKKVQITGKVLQNMKDGYSYYIRLAMDDDYDKVVLVDIASYDYDDIIAEDDNVTFYGTAEGLTSYESTWGKEVTLPSMSSEEYTVNSYGN
ncbi:hypothetical protein [Streptococcus gallolyticus]|uniref:hypothetical protein n=1 Tax=Streptococcus gallolyticus TaxID=315405 RepID=UPI0022846BC4|nr:hypothetical protein [Streptococcus gallolyticus]MCY7187539.1 hypothetical protein [Streptococcus gallolyticus subsp. gallolyticus]